MFWRCLDKFSSNHSDNIQNLSNILNCRYLNLDTIRDTSTKTHFIGEDKFIKSMTSSDETISRAAEYFEKKGRKYFTSSFLENKLHEDIDFFPYGADIFNKEMTERRPKINQRYTKVIELFEEYKRCK